MGAVGGRPRRRQVRASAVELRRIVGGIELHQDIACLDDLVVVDANAQHLPGNAGGHAHHTPFDLRVVGRLPAEVNQVPGG